MAMNITQKIMARASGKSFVSVGELLWVEVDVLMTHDPCTPAVVSIFKREFGNDARVWNNDRYVMIPDHFIYTADIAANRNLDIMRAFAAEQNIHHFYDVGTPRYKGVCHIALAEGGHNRPGEVLIGTDSHSVTSGAFGTFGIGVGNTDAAFILGTGKALLRVPSTIKIELTGEFSLGVMAKDFILAVVRDLTVQGGTYRTLEFTGSAVENMAIDDRMTICNMVVECGAKNGIMAPNDAVLEYLNSKDIKQFSIVNSDSDAVYEQVLKYDLSSLKPLVAKPHSPDNVVEVSAILGQEIDQVYIGSCTGGKASDFIAAASVLYNEKVSVPTYAIPATRETINGIATVKVRDRSVLEILNDAGVYVSFEPGCGACCGGPKDTFGRANGPVRVASTTNRNFPGRMGDKSAQVYLVSPYTAAATAISGKIQQAF